MNGMTAQNSKSRFLPTLTEVVHVGQSQRVTSLLEPASSNEALVPQTFAAELEEELRGRLRALLNEQIQLALPQLHAALDATIKETVQKAIAQNRLGEL